MARVVVVYCLLTLDWEFYFSIISVFCVCVCFLNYRNFKFDVNEIFSNDHIGHPVDRMELD